MTPTSQFYTGLVARLYEPLAGNLPAPEVYQRFVEKHGEPALELACGAGNPMLALLRSGLNVHGLDASADLLDILNHRAKTQGLAPTVYCQTMQTLAVENTYACCYLAGPSFCLIDDLDDAQQTLQRVYAALIPGGHFLLSVFKPDATQMPSEVRSTTLENGDTATVQAIDEQGDTHSQLITTRLRYTQTHGEKTETLDRAWVLRWYTAAQLTDMLAAAGFSIVRIAGDKGKTVTPEDTSFFVIAKK
ncbi:MAG: class I SAM-dependent methyltransferase [bacterium]